jgi:serine/threonine protein kinase
MNACILQVEKEVVILRQLHHENLVGYLFVADQGSKISIVMEWAGDSLREHRTVTQPKQYCEAVARHMVYQLTHALVYLHSKVSECAC